MLVLLNPFSVDQDVVCGSMLDESSGSSVTELRIAEFNVVNAAVALGVTDG